MAADENSWSGPPGAERVLGDSGPWTWYLAEAWQHAAAPDLFVGPARHPDHYGTRQPLAGDGLGRQIAYWAPLLHLTTYGLGWRMPELGLWRWLQQGRPTEDPVLACLDARYGQDVELIMAWLCDGGGNSLRGNTFQAWDAPPVPLPPELNRTAASTRERPQYADLFSGGSDPMHLIWHLSTQDADAGGEVTKFAGDPKKGAVDFILMSDTYRSLFKTLHDGVVAPTTVGRSTRVGLICPSIGWLGEYRRSRETGLWFRGRHRWHILGNWTA